MIPVLYSDTDAIRAAIGVTDVELPDAMFGAQGLEMQMRVSLYRKVPTHGTVYLAGMESDASAADVYAADLLALYCMYFGAIRAVEMVLALRQQVSDGKQEVSRFNVDWQKLTAALQRKLDEIGSALVEAVNGTTSGVSYFGKASPDYDPVANI